MSRKTKTKPAFAVGDLVTVRAPTADAVLWNVVELGPRMECMIREHGTDYAPQRWDTSVLWAIGCAWFALCDNAAVTTLPHKVLGRVPCCQRCADKVKRLGG